MTDQKSKTDDLPEGLTLVDPGAPAAAAPATDPLPEGLTEITPGAKAPGSGVLQNPGGDLPDKNTPPTPPVPPTPPPERSPSDFILNQLPKSAGNFILNTLGAVAHPIDTVEGLAKLASGGVQAAARAAGIDIPENEYDQVAQAFAHYATSRYGGADQIKEALYTDPVGVMSDFSLLAGGVGGVAELANMGKVGEVLGAVSKATNPAWLATKPVSAAVGHFAPKLPGAFDPATADFGEATGPAAPAAAPQVDVAKLKQEATVQRAYQIAKLDRGERAIPGRDDWLRAEEDISKSWKPPAAPAVEPAPAPSRADALYSLIKKNFGALAGTVGVGGTAELLTRHFTGSALSGVLTGIGIKAIPYLLKSPAGQDILARIGPGSTPAQVAAAARDLVPVLNALGWQQQQRQSTIDLSQSPYMHAKGGPAPDSELARIQRERLPLRSATLRTLQR